MPFFGFSSNTRFRSKLIVKSIGIFVDKLLTSNETNTSEEVGWTLLSYIKSIHSAIT